MPTGNSGDIAGLRSFNNSRKLQRERAIQAIATALTALMDEQDPMAKKRIVSALTAQDLAHAFAPKSTREHPLFTAVFQEAKKRAGIKSTLFSRDWVSILDPDTAQTPPDNSINNTYHYWYRRPLLEIHAIIRENESLK
jgi:hypothetical protein